MDPQLGLGYHDKVEPTREANELSRSNSGRAYSICNTEGDASCKQLRLLWGSEVCLLVQRIW